MKEKLLERLSLMDKAIVEAQQRLGQANADLNMLNGCRQELVHIINMVSEPVVPPAEQCAAVQDDCVAQAVA